MSERPDVATFCGGAQVRCDLCMVRDTAICSVLSASELARLTRIARSVHATPGHTLFHEGDPAEDVFTVVEGVVQLYKLLEDGRRQIVGFLVAGDFIGLAFGNHYVYSAEAVTATRLCAFRRAPFIVLLGEYPHLEQNLLARASTELAASHEHMLVLGRKSAKERVATFLLRFAERRGVPPGERLDLPMGRLEIADYLGLTIETVSRTFTVLRREGLIRLEGRSSVRILDPSRLAAIAGL
ncbi:Nitrogen fixation regulation protein FixK [bacterium HR40]|nr:Nitrogen fixation regulation protein FixK [bacterium HR40]